MTAATSDADPRLYRWRFGAAEFDEARRELRVGGLPVDLEHKPLQVLALLLRHAGEVVTKDELFDSVWAGRVTVDHVLSTAIGKLRKALGEEGEGVIVTVPRIGYRFVGKVERMAVGHRIASALRFEPGQPVPGREHFLLQRQLARTRGSEVWLAGQPRSHEARVFKFGLDGERLSMIKREATLARVLRDTLGERTDFVRVFDWNFETEPYFLECEYGGVDFAEWSVGQPDPSGWNQARRLAFFLQVVDAVAAAHAVGVLHKDLKPANVLVQATLAGGWQARLTDFGSSRLLQPERLAELGITSLGMTMSGDPGSDAGSGTPLYLAPEVIAGQPCTVRSDVYALGVMLYQWLAGDLRRPMASGWERDIDDVLLRDDIARATDGDPTRRLGSAGEFADRLRRLQARHAEREQTAQAGIAIRNAQQALDHARTRRPWLIATIAALALGLLGSLWFAFDAGRERQASQLQAARADAVRGFLQDLLANADPGVPAAGHEVTVREALGRATSDIARRFAKTPDTEASIRLTAGTIYTSLGEFDNAERHLRRAVALLTATTGPYSQQTLRARYQLATALSAASDYADAAALLRDTDTAAGTRLRGDPQVALASTQAWGRHYLLQAQADRAAPYLESALQRQLQVEPDDIQNLYALRSDLAQAYVRIGRQDEAVKLLRRLQDPSYAKAGISASKRATGMLFYGSALLYAGRPKQAEPVLKAALDAITATYGIQSMQAMQAQSALGNLYATEGDFGKALPYVAAAGERACALSGPTHQFCLQQQGNEGVIRFQLGDVAGALPKLKAAHAGFLQQAGPDSPGTHVIGYYFATALLETGDNAGAASLAATLDAAKIEAGSPGDHWPSRVAALKGAILIDQHHVDEGMAQLRPAVEEMRRAGMQAWMIAPFEKRLTAGEKPLLAGRRI